MEIINGYTLQEPPYKGGMALVYKGQKDAFTRAFKMLRPDKAANNARLCERFLKEVQNMMKLDHPNIVKILDAYPHVNSTGSTVTVLEMEWLNGMDLQRYIEKYAQTGMEVKTVIKIALQVIAGLEYAHKKSILHLDIKPSNLFRTKDGYIKIIDFGIAKVVGENAEIVEGAANVTVVTETGESTFKGTLAYAAPEQQVGGKLSYATDIYSFGKTLHFLITGTTDPSAEIKDSQIAHIVTKCTADNPKHRYQSFAEVREAFENHEEKKCPFCGEIVKQTAKFCPNCGKPLNETQSASEQEVCPRCKKPRNGNDRFCDKCGWDFTSNTSNGSDSQKSKTNEYNQKSNFHQREIKGYRCSKCGMTTKAYYDGKVFFCNYCGAGSDCLSPVYNN